jgi:D,D-heptose 1,7-bisphosphate phosphatase
MQAVILAGGRGTRLGDMTREIPKPMLLLEKKPLLHHQVDLLIKYGIRDIIILVNYLKEPIMNYFRDGSAFDARIRYFEETTPLGTVGGIKEIEDWLTGDFLVLYGDVMINMDLARLIAFHQLKYSQCTLVLHPNDHPYDSDLVETDTKNRVVAFHPKPHDPGETYHNLVNAGAYVLSPKIFPFLEKGKKADFGRDIFPLIFNQLSMFGYRTTEYLKDMGTPERLDKVRHDLESGRIRKSSYEYSQKAIFLDRDGVLNVERSYISKPEELELYDFTAAAIRKINQSGYLSIVVTNQSAVARNLCTEEDVRSIHRSMETTLGHDKAWLDGIYYCPHHPDKGFPEENPKYKIDCDCRKPRTGMFRKAAEDFNISTGDSFMIGDSERDIQAGINAGCVTLGVRTGYGIKKTGVLPDYMFKNLAEAVDFIVDDPLRPYFEIIYAKFKEFKEKRPWVILIGGNTRTGKSTLASYLRLAFEKNGRKTLSVSLDNWLLPESDRKQDMDVYARFRLPQIETDLKNLIKGDTLYKTTYVNHPERNALPLILDPQGVSIILVEGVVALSSPGIRGLADLRLFTSLHQDVFLQRMEEYYSWRGKSSADTTLLVEKRKKDEYQLIEKESKFADMIINAYSS